MKNLFNRVLALFVNLVMVEVETISREGSSKLSDDGKTLTILPGYTIRKYRLLG